MQKKYLLNTTKRVIPQLHIRSHQLNVACLMIKRPRGLDALLGHLPDWHKCMLDNSLQKIVN